MAISNINKTLVYGRRILQKNTPIEPPISLETKKIVPDLPSLSTHLERSTPEDEGLSSEYILSYLTDLQNDMTIDMHNILIVKNGKVITEAQFGPYSLDIPRYSFSACKSIVSLALGCLYDEGKITLDEKIVDIFSDEIPQAYKLFKTGITVEDVLTMRSGILFNEATSSVTKNWLDGYFSSTMFGEVGKTFNYNSLNTYILSRIIIKRCGMSLSKYLDKKLFTFMGIKDYYWETCPMGYEIGGWGLFIKHEDMAKLALLVLNEGNYDGKRLISKEYIKKATTSQVKTPENGGAFNYGYQIWVGRKIKAYLFNGMFGQNAIIFPNNNMVIVSGAGIDEMFQQSSYFTHTIKYFSSKLEPMKSKGSRNLKEFLDFIKTPDYDPTPMMYSNIGKNEINSYLEKLNGKTFKSTLSNGAGLIPFTTSLVSGHHSKGLDTLKFEVKNDVLHILYNEFDVSYDIPITPGKFVTKNITFGINEYKIAVTGQYATNEDGDFAIKFRIYELEMPTSKYYKLMIKGDTIELSTYETPGMPFLITLISSYIENIQAIPLVKQMLSNIDVEKVADSVKDRFAYKLSLKKI